LKYLNISDDEHKQRDFMKQSALKSMEEQQMPINFEAVASYAKVSKTCLYADPALKEQILKIKNKSKNNRYMQNQAERLSAKDKEIGILTKQNKLLRQQVDELKMQLEVAYAELYKKGE
jgi:hypothetical protein